jgi:D-serine deaminase-like pyridoxal phosphate-dependent protein
VDLDIVEKNIAKMAALLRTSGIHHRPHIKTTKSVTLAKKQLEAGAIGITVSKLSEAEVFFEAGFTEILIAYSIVGKDKLQRFARLHSMGSVITVVDSEAVAFGLSQVGVEAGKEVQVLIELDGGLHRGGRQPGEDAAAFAKSIKDLPGINVKGVMGYFGTIYRNRDDQGFVQAVRQENKLLKHTVTLLRNLGFQVEIISSGSTPSSLYSEYYEGVTEVRAGNYIFYDASGIGMGVAEERDCALRVIATVISTPLPGRATIDAGTKTLTSDKAHHLEGFGLIVGCPGVQITALNEEHGFVEFDPQAVRLSVGDRLEIIPNHSCVIPNLFNKLQGVRGGKATEMITVDARGCNY